MDSHNSDFKRDREAPSSRLKKPTHSHDVIELGDTESEDESFFPTQNFVSHGAKSNSVSGLVRKSSRVRVENKQSNNWYGYQRPSQTLYEQTTSIGNKDFSENQVLFIFLVCVM